MALRFNVIDNPVPTLTSQTASGAVGNITWGVTSDEAGGTIYVAARLAADAVLTRTEIQNGTGNAVATGTDATPTADSANGGTLTGLAAETYIVDMFHNDSAGAPSAVVSSEATAVTSGNLELEGDASGNLDLEGDTAGVLELEGTF